MQHTPHRPTSYSAYAASWTSRWRFLCGPHVMYAWCTHASCILHTHRQAENRGGDTCLPGVLGSVSAGQFALLVSFTDTGATPLEAFTAITAIPTGATLRGGSGEFATVVELAAGVTLADVAGGRLLLKNSFRGAEVIRVPLCVCGALSAEVEMTTKDAGVPGLAQPPTLVEATGGRLALRMASPADTGGVGVTSFTVVLHPHNLAGMEAYLQVCMRVGEGGAARDV